MAGPLLLRSGELLERFGWGRQSGRLTGISTNHAARGMDTTFKRRLTQFWRHILARPGVQTAPLRLIPTRGRAFRERRKLGDEPVGHADPQA
jgi:hypothetical protein